MKKSIRIFFLKRRYVLILALLAISAAIFYAVSYPAARAAYAIGGGTPAYRAAFTSGRGVPNGVCFDAVATDGVFAGTATGLRELPGTLGLRLSGLNDRQAVVVESAKGLRLVSSVDGTAYVALRDEEEGTLFVGHPFVCENRDVVLALSRRTPTSPWTLEAHNPTDKAVKVRISTNRRFRAFGFERTIELAAGESKDFEIVEGTDGRK